jgi:NAD+ kinase
MNFTILYNDKMEDAAEVKDILESSLVNKGITADILSVSRLPSSACQPQTVNPSDNFVFVIGGDGTILKAARFYAKYKTPVFGVNLGRLGFLSQSPREDIENSAEKILAGKYKIDERIMLKSDKNAALNDFVIKGASAGRTSRFSLKINGKFVCDYPADGIIVTTPTGSTAYGLSAGGPVLAPGLDVLAIVPICAHTLTARPLVVPADEKITVCTKGAGIVSADGQEFYEFDSEIQIEKSEHCAKLALLEDTAFYSTLRDKLHWGVSPACKMST